MINHFELFGLEQVFNRFVSKAMNMPVLKVTGFYKIVRHPIMLGFMIAFWARPHMSLGDPRFRMRDSGETAFITDFLKCYQ